MALILLEALLALLLFVVIVGGIYAWRTRDLLPTGDRVPAPAFELTDLQGQPWSLGSLEGKPAVLYFFAPWCGVCAASSPQLRWFDRWQGDDVQVVLVGLDWSLPLDEAWERVGFERPVQGNLDPASLLAPWRELRFRIDDVLDRKLIAKSLLTAEEIAWVDAYHAQVRALLSPRLEGEDLAWVERETQPL